MTAFVLDASVLIKCVVQEANSAEALALLQTGLAIAPDLIVSECANIIWKKTTRGEFSVAEASFTGGLLAAADVEVVPTRATIQLAIDLACVLSHPAYDCAYLALAVARGCPFVTADLRLVGKLGGSTDPRLARRVLPLADAPSALGRL